MNERIEQHPHWNDQPSPEEVERNFGHFQFLPSEGPLGMPRAPGTPGSPAIQNEKFASPPPGSLPWLSQITLISVCLNNCPMALGLIFVIMPQLPFTEAISPCPCPFLPLAFPSSSLFFLPGLYTDKYLLPSLQLWAVGARLTPTPHHLLAAPSLTFVTFGSLGARWAWWSLKVESERTGPWKPTTHTMQSARVRTGSGQSQNGAGLSPYLRLRNLGGLARLRNTSREGQSVSFFSPTNSPVEPPQDP